jgi:toxin HigB-1
MKESLAYFITFTSYGTWLHGRALGSVDREHSTPIRRFCRTSARSCGKPSMFPGQREVVLCTISEVAQGRGRRLWAAHVLRDALASYRGSIYNTPMIQSFVCADTERLFNRIRVARFAGIEAVARRKLNQLHAAASLSFLRAPPGNRLKALKGDRAGQYSIRINDQFRLCFAWGPRGPERVEIVDYH